MASRRRATTRRYQEARLEGHVYDAGQDQPFGTIPLVSWFSPSRNDHFLTTDPRWVPGAR